MNPLHLLRFYTGVWVCMTYNSPLLISHCIQTKPVTFSGDPTSQPGTAEAAPLSSQQQQQSVCQFQPGGADKLQVTSDDQYTRPKTLPSLGMCEVFFEERTCDGGFGGKFDEGILLLWWLNNKDVLSVNKVIKWQCKQLWPIWQVRHLLIDTTHFK